MVLDEVVVTGTRSEINPRHLPMSVSTIGTEQIAGRMEPSLLPLMTEEVPGLFITGRGIMGYGVAAGSSGAMSIRGIGSSATGSPTTGVLILLDGHPQYMGLMGHPLADTYLSAMAEKVEVVRGPASVLYGSNAMGGVINIISKKQRSDGIHTNARLMYGSYNTLGAEAHNSFRKGKFGSFVSLDYSSTDGHRENMDFSRYSGYARAQYDFSPQWKTFADISLSRFNASNPGSLSSPVVDNDADITRGVASFSVENNYGRTSGALKLFYNWGLHKINDGYSPGGDPKDYRFRSTDDMFGLLLYQSYSFFRGNNVTAGVDIQRFGGRARNKFADHYTDIADKAFNNLAGYLSVQQSLGSIFSVNAGLRVDYHEHTGTEWVPQAGLTAAPSEHTTLKAIVSKGFRNPTIREMYMFPPQNPLLEPERLINYELSVSHYFPEHSLLLDLNLFYIDGDNTIQSVVTDGKPKYMNTGRIENYGLEAAARYRATSALSFSANYSLLHMKYKVIAAPEHKLFAGVDYKRLCWGVSTGVQYINGLYTSVNPEEKRENFLLWNVRGSYSPVYYVEFFVKGENLLAQKYEINAGYPMPRATFFGGVSLRL